MHNPFSGSSLFSVGKLGDTISSSSLCLCASVVKSVCMGLTTKTPRDKENFSGGQYPHNLAKSRMIISEVIRDWNMVLINAVINICFRAQVKRQLYTSCSLIINILNSDIVGLGRATKIK